MTTIEVSFTNPFSPKPKFAIAAKGYWRVDGKVTGIAGHKVGVNGTGIRLAWHPKGVNLLFAVKTDLSLAASGQF